MGFFAWWNHLLQDSPVASFILLALPSLIRIMKEHNEINPAEVDRLKKMLDEKEVAQVERVQEVERWVKKEIDIEENLWVANELLF